MVQDNNVAAQAAVQALPQEPNIDKTAISPYQNYCDGFSSPGAIGNGYVNFIKVSAASTKATDDFLLDGIVAYDKAECKDAYIGQINMITASSFNGLVGQVWGYDVAQHDAIKKDQISPLFGVKQWKGDPMRVYDGGPLIEAGIRLMGTESNRMYPLLPGAHTICANKGITAYRPLDGQPLEEGQAYGVWSYISISFAKDGTTDANCFIEDAGLWTKNTSEKDLVAFLEEHRHAIANCTVACGADSHVVFDKSFISYAYCMMKPGEVGTAITVSPYMTLAQNAIPAAGFNALYDMTLYEWMEDQKKRFPQRF